MDYFAKQRRSRSQTHILIALMLCAVTGVVLAADLVVSLSAWWFFEAERLPLAIHIWLVGLILLLIIVFASRRFYTLREGGEAVARLAQARKVRRDTQNPAERRLLNVVEEMSIASGVAVPSVWTLDMEDGINAFAAGYSPNQAAVVVTRGALEALSRDELQGVIGHEFSHILNGDMRLNVVLVGILAGIVVVGEAGLVFIRLGSEATDWGAFPLLIFGILLGMVGYIGVFCGRLIKAAVSRQREFLADASSALFTRNPDGLAGALRKIASREEQQLETAFAGELSHMFFSQAVAMKMFRNLLATHPPIEERLASLISLKGKATGLPDGDTDGSLAGRVGAVRPEHVEMAAALLGSIPGKVKKALETAEGARAVVYAYLTPPEGKFRNVQEKILAGAGAGMMDQVNHLAVELKGLGAAYRLPVIELALPALQGMTSAEKDRFLSVVDGLVKADGKFTLAEYAILSVLRRHLTPAARWRERGLVKSLACVKSSVLIVISLLAEAGHKDQRERKTAFGMGMAALGWKEEPPSTRINRIDDLTKALDTLRRLDPMEQRKIFNVCGKMAQHDERLTLEEYELLRVLGMALDCPMPPEVDWRMVEKNRKEGE